jgi:hypothetical protein
MAKPFSINYDTQQDADNKDTHTRIHSHAHKDAGACGSIVG